MGKNPEWNDSGIIFQLELQGKSLEKEYGMIISPFVLSEIRSMRYYPDIIGYCILTGILAA